MTFNSLTVRPYQLLCLICRQGRENPSDKYQHEEYLNKIQAAIKLNPGTPLSLCCNTGTVFHFQNPGRNYDTAEGEAYNDLRDLTILQRLGLLPGTTLPAIDCLQAVADAIPSCENICSYPETEAPGWPACRFAQTGNYERGFKQGLGTLLPTRSAEEKHAIKKTSARACAEADILRIRPHHLLCMACFHAGRHAEDIQPIAIDNLEECVRAVQRNPEIPVKLIQGPCMVCPPCDLYYAPGNFCLGGKSMSVRDERKDLETLRRIGLKYGDVLPARELYRRIFNAIPDTTTVCGFGDGIERARAWRICGGPTGKKEYIRAREAGLGIPGISADE